MNNFFTIVGLGLLTVMLSNVQGHAQLEMQPPITDALAVQTDNNWDIFMTVETDIAGSAVAVGWTAQPPLATIFNAIRQYPFNIIKDERESDYKFTLSSDDGITFDVIGNNDTLKTENERDEISTGILTSATSSWFVDSTTISPAGTTSVNIKAASIAIVNPFDPRKAEWEAVATSVVKDPIHFPAISPGESVKLDITLNEGQVLKATGDAVAGKQIFVGTDIPGYETLYQLDIEAREINGTPTLTVDFLSHAQAGLDNVAIANSVFNAFSFDTVEQQFVMGGSVPIIEGPLPIPEGQAFDLSVNLSASAEATSPVVIPPDPTTVILSPVAASETGMGTEFGVPLENMINQSGLLSGFVSGETSFDDFISDDAKNLAIARTGPNWNFWSSPVLSSGLPNGAALTLDFGEEQTIDGLAIWNGSLKEISICVSETADGPCESVGDFTLSSKTGTESTVVADVVEFNQNHAGRYVRIDVRSLYRPDGPDEHSAWIAFVNEIAASVLLPDDGLLGDFNLNDELDVGDVNLLMEHIRNAGSNALFDVTLDGVVDHTDLEVWVNELKNTYFGDANLDGEFGSGDLVDVFVAGEYEDDIALNSTWADGDWNGDGDFGSGDLVAAFQDAGYERGPRAAANTVPEPSSLIMLLGTAIGIIVRRSR